MTIEFDGQNNKLGTTTANSVTIKTNDTDAITIDSSQNVGVGTTSPSVTFDAEADGATVAHFNRATSDGDIIELQKDGTAVGSIYNGGSNLGINSSGGLLLVDDIITPTSGADNTKDLGRSSARWKDAYIGGNIYLGGTGSTNTLDDYEEGTWTPTLTFSSSASGSLNYTQQEGIYVKVGRLVHVSVFVAWNANNFSANSGAFEIQGLPFVNNNNNLYRGGASITYSDGTFTGLTIYGQAFRAENSQSKFRFNHGINTGGNISSEVTSYTNIASVGSFMISGTYQTN